MVRQFDLGDADCLMLDGFGIPWDTITDAASRWLIMRGWPIPFGYTIGRADIAVLIAPNYPVEPLDMAFFFPALMRRDNKTIHNADTNQAIEGKSYQRWSRHYTPANPWIPSEHNVATHLALVDLWIRHELVR